jgi:predicted DNA-binding transcriptional regulator AlpA
MLMMATTRRDPDIKPALLADCDVAEMLGIHRSTLWAWLDAGLIPKPVRFGVAYRGGQRRSRSTRWRRCDIELFLECRCSMSEFSRRQGASRR